MAFGSVSGSRFYPGRRLLGSAGRDGGRGLHAGGGARCGRGPPAGDRGSDQGDRRSGGVSAPCRRRHRGGKFAADRDRHAGALRARGRAVRVDGASEPGGPPAGHALPRWLRAGLGGERRLPRGGELLELDRGRPALPRARGSVRSGHDPVRQWHQRRGAVGDHLGDVQDRGGAVGNVNAGTLVKVDGNFTDTHGNPVSISVRNPEAASGGTDRQTIAQIQALAPESIRVLSRRCRARTTRSMPGDFRRSRAPSC